MKQTNLIENEHIIDQIYNNLQEIFYKNKPIPLPKDLFHDDKYDVIYFDYKIDSSLTLEQIQKDVVKKSFKFINKFCNIKKIRGSYLYSLNTKNNRGLTMFLYDLLEQIVDGIEENRFSGWNFPEFIIENPTSEVSVRYCIFYDKICKKLGSSTK